MTINRKIKNYLEKHPGATVQDYMNQKHKMHVVQYARTIRSKHSGSKSLKKLLQIW